MCADLRGCHLIKIHRLRRWPIWHIQFQRLRISAAHGARNIGRHLRQQQLLPAVRQLVFVGVLLQLYQVARQQTVGQFAWRATVFKTQVNQELPINRQSFFAVSAPFAPTPNACCALVKNSTKYSCGWDLINAMCSSLVMSNTRLPSAWHMV